MKTWFHRLAQAAAADWQRPKPTEFISGGSWPLDQDGGLGGREFEEFTTSESLMVRVVIAVHLGDCCLSIGRKVRSAEDEDVAVRRFKMRRG